MKRRVVITGIGLVTPLGAEVETVWKRLLNGESGVDKITLFDASNFPTKIAAEVKNWDVSDIGESPEDWKKQDRHTKFAVGAAHKAMVDAGLWDPKTKTLDSSVEPTRMGVYTGAGEGEQDFGLFTEMILAGVDAGEKSGRPGTCDVGAFIAKGLQILDPISELEQEPNMPAAHLAAMFGALGPNVNCLTACAASSQA
ncbi:MAG TPA: beta-ketoacyl-[acyl-carrier-protein] synthase II, partial [Planctomycetaceae bacterium]|nr:beta-ketoacyl-[acyl-carrier-protein] synthase II [Planctomycetaceae bacterium]